MLKRMSRGLPFNRLRPTIQECSQSVRSCSKRLSLGLSALAVAGTLAIAPGQERVPSNIPAQPDPPRPSSQSGSSQASGRYYVKFRPGTKPAERVAVAVQHGVGILHNYSSTDAMAIAVINENALNGLSRSNSVLQILPDRVIPLAAPPPPKAPENLAANESGFDVTLTWTQKGKVDSYNVERCDATLAACTPFVVDKAINGLPKDPKSYTDTVPAVGDYVYQVIAVSGGTDSPASDPAEANVTGGGGGPPLAPTLLSATPSGTDVGLTWSDVADEDGYRVQRCVGGGCGGFVDHSPSLPAGTTGYTDQSLANDTYGYQVIAFNTSGDSTPSNSLPATITAGPPPPGPADPLVREPRQILSYAVERVGRPVAGSTGIGIGVALLDSGADFQHADLAPGLAPDAPFGTLIGGVATGTSFNAVTPATSCQDDNAHGTHMAGLIGARDNDIGIVGVAPEATIYCVKVANDLGGVSLLDLLAGLDWVYSSVTNNNLNPEIKVVNMSLGGPAQNTQLETDIETVINLIMQLGVVVVTAAGNDPNLETDQMFPAKIQDAITVSGTTATIGLNTVDPNLPWVFADTVFGGPVTTFGTTDGPGVDIAAPADERHDLTAGFFFYYGILSTSLTGVVGAPAVDDLISRKLPAPNGPFEARGTSNSSALVSGVMARIMQQELEAGNLNGNFADVTSARTIMLGLADGADPGGDKPIDHPWTVQPISGVFQTPDGIFEGMVQAPMPLPGP